MYESPWMLWLLFGGALCIAELFSGTFYLLLAGTAAFAAAAAAYLGAPAAGQVAAAALVAIAGLPLVKRVSRRQGPARMDYDTGQSTTLIESGGALCAQHSGSLWRVREAGGKTLAAGETVRIVAVDGNQLVVEKGE